MARFNWKRARDPHRTRNGAVYASGKLEAVDSEDFRKWSRDRYLGELKTCFDKYKQHNGGEWLRLARTFKCALNAYSDDGECLECLKLAQTLERALDAHPDIHETKLYRQIAAAAPHVLFRKRKGTRQRKKPKREPGSREVSKPKRAPKPKTRRRRSANKRLRANVSSEVYEKRKKR